MEILVILKVLEILEVVFKLLVDLGIWSEYENLYL